MPAFKEVFAKNDVDAKSFQGLAEEWVTLFAGKAEEIGAKGAVTESQWKEFDLVKRDIVKALDAVQLSILRKIPLKQNEDTLGAEVQEWVLESISKYSKALKGVGGSENPSSIASHCGYLSAIAALHKDKKDRPDDYPATLDAVRLEATERHWATSLANSYSSIINMLVDVSTKLSRNKELLQHPKREYNTMM
eukprot:TRINITY_DN1255_c0_g1_i10.p1 TRINITY_DN1255_c0_g1~~TRINITY_DN1255_c0_g1_i10.p1  ORF type:complete len:193 (+),score=72.63 TRINITY_DN1255_c0_g1_i10:57-635(+)